MKKNVKWVLLTMISFMQMPGISFANPDRERTLMPFAGAGYGQAGNQGEGRVDHVGVRFMLSANKKQRYGIELSQLRFDNGKFDINQDNRYIALGFVIEQTLYNHFLMSIGTVGYLHSDDDQHRPFGIRSNLGWEQNIFDTSHEFFVVYRGDLIFSRDETRIHSLSVGVRLEY